MEIQFPNIMKNFLRIALMIVEKKNTLLPGDIVVILGISGAKLTQNYCELVVTSLKIYNACLNHGFTSVKASNFGIPLCLIIARETAIFRVAKNDLLIFLQPKPLYHLTMSFVSSVPALLLLRFLIQVHLKKERKSLVKYIEREDNLKLGVLRELMANGVVTLCSCFAQECVSGIENDIKYGRTTVMDEFVYSTIRNQLVRKSS